MSKILVDTNILVYTKDQSSIFHQSSLRLFNSGAELYTTSKNITEYYAVVTKGTTPLLSGMDALEDINEFISYCHLLYPNRESHQKLSELIIQHQPKGLLIHDFEIAAIGLANGVNKIATLNKADFKNITEIEVIVVA